MSEALLLYLCSLSLRCLLVAAMGAVAALAARAVVPRHAIWLAVLLVMLGLPLFDFLLPAAFIPASVHQIVDPFPVFFEFSGAPSAASAALDLRPQAGVAGRLMAGALAIYFSLAVLLLLRLSLGWRKIRQLVRRGGRVRAAGVDAVLVENGFTPHFPAVYAAQSVRVPMTVGVLRPRIVLPDDWRCWDPWKLRAVLCHELAHVRRFDCAVAAAAAFNTCLFWFNPLSWWLERQLSSLSEKASDEACLQRTGDAVRYAEVLLQFAAALRQGQRFQVGGVAMAKPRKMRSRIERVLSIERPGSGVLHRAGWVVLLSVAAPVLYAASALHVAPNSLPELLAPPEAVATPSLAPPMMEAVVSQATAVSKVAPESGITLKKPAASRPPVVTTNSETTATSAPEKQQAGPLAILKKVQPLYPPLAKQARITGVVVLSVQVGSDGRAKNVSVVSGHPLLREAAAEAVRQWEWEAPLINGSPGEVVLNITINFSLGKDEGQLGNSGIARSIPSAPDGESRSYAFTINGIQDRIISFQAADGSARFSYGCPDCTFLVHAGGVGQSSTAGTPGVLLRLSEDTREIELTCRSQECVVTTVLDGGGTFLQTLRMNITTTLSTSGRISVSFLK